MKRINGIISPREKLALKIESSKNRNKFFSLLRERETINADFGLNRNNETQLFQVSIWNKRGSEVIDYRDIEICNGREVQSLNEITQDQLNYRKGQK